MKTILFILALSLIGFLSAQSTMYPEVEARMFEIGVYEVDTTRDFTKISMAYGNFDMSRFEGPVSWRGRVVDQVDLVFTKHPFDLSEWKVGFDNLLQKRMEMLFMLDSTLFSNPEVRWNHILQTQFGTSQEARDLFHGFVVYSIDSVEWKERLLASRGEPEVLVEEVIEEEPIDLTPEFLPDPVLIEASDLTGEIRGIVKSASDNAPIENVRVIVFENEKELTYDYTDRNGNYRMNVTGGENYRVTYLKRGFLSAENRDLDVPKGTIKYLEAVLQIPKTRTANGSMSGKITNAISGVGVKEPKIYFRPGINNYDGEILDSLTGNYNGKYQIDSLPPGNYTLEADAEGYNRGFFSAISIGNRNSPDQNGAITPELEEGAIRMILTWGLTPYDLDAHLRAPGRKHIYWENKQSGSQTMLDVDDVSSYGPETITVLKPVKKGGTYRYYVHDYSHKRSLRSNYLAQSGAKVEVWKGNELVATLNVPNESGNLWKVLEYNGKKFKFINKMSFHSNEDTVGR